MWGRKVEIYPKWERASVSYGSKGLVFIKFIHYVKTLDKYLFSHLCLIGGKINVYFKPFHCISLYYHVWYVKIFAMECAWIINYMKLKAETIEAFLLH